MSIYFSDEAEVDSVGHTSMYYQDLVVYHSSHREPTEHVLEHSD